VEILRDADAMLKRAAVAVFALTVATSAWAGAAENKALRDAAYSLDLEKVRDALKKVLIQMDPIPKPI
jgi:hypothetical protein